MFHDCHARGPGWTRVAEVVAGKSDGRSGPKPASAGISEIFFVLCPVGDTLMVSFPCPLRIFSQVHMSQLDDNDTRLSIKLVYYGPALSGKTTNLLYLHDHLQPELAGELMTLETKDDRTLFFDLLPLGFRTPSGMLVKVKLFTVPGQVQHDATRKAVLSRADGVVFVADSQVDQAINNGESFQNLVENVARVGLDLQRLPLVVQFNKRDLSRILSRKEILGRWGQAPWPLIFSVALSGPGVVTTFVMLLRQVYAELDRQYGMAQDHGVSCEQFVAGIVGQAPIIETEL